MSGVAYDGLRNCVIASGGLSGILNALLATIDVGDEVVVTDPTYVGLLNRIRLAACRAPCRSCSGPERPGSSTPRRSVQQSARRRARCC
jgi:aspartate/methionine/tyrosine aminotransferase